MKVQIEIPGMTPTLMDIPAGSFRDGFLNISVLPPFRFKDDLTVEPTAKETVKVYYVATSDEGLPIFKP